MNALYSTLHDTHDQTTANCLGLIERHAKQMMRVGGFAGYAKEQLNHGAPITAEERAQIIDIARQGKLGMTEIARVVGRSVTSVWRVMVRAGVKAKDTRGAPVGGWKKGAV